jgi:hypothetical protein
LVSPLALSDHPRTTTIAAPATTRIRRSSAHYDGALWMTTTAMPFARDGGWMRTPINAGRPFRRDQASDLGLNAYRLTRDVAAGLLRRPLRQVYVDGTTADDRDQRIACLALVLPEHAVVWGRSAAWVWGVNGFGPDERHLMTPEYVVPHHRGRKRDRRVRVVEAALTAPDVVELGALRLTSPTRTALDLARHLHRPWALAALDAFTSTGLVGVSELNAGLPRLFHHPGVVQARELVRLVEPKTESWGESVLRLRIIDAGFPRPEAQIEILAPDGRVLYRIDLGYPQLRIGIEYDGEDHHGTRAQQQHDEARRRDLGRRFGWTVHGYGRGAVLGRRPGVELAVGELLSLTPRLPRRW